MLFDYEDYIAFSFVYHILVVYLLQNVIWL